MGMGHVTLQISGLRFRVCLATMSRPVADIICRRLGYNRLAGFVPGINSSEVYAEETIYKTQASCRGGSQLLVSH